MTSKMFISILIISFIMMCGCTDDGNDDGTSDTRDHRQDMRDLVINISRYAKTIDEDFIVIPQNGHELLTVEGEGSGQPSRDYMDAIDGVGREDLFYGYDEDDVATPVTEREYMIEFMDIAEENGIEVLVTDYCKTRVFVDDSYEQSSHRKYISFAADHRELDNIPAYPPSPYNTNNLDITSLGDGQNFLYLLNPEGYDTKDAFLTALGGSDHDIIIIDPFFQGTEEFTKSEISSLKLKNNRGARLVIAYMSIGEAEDYRYYWESDWAKDDPSWLADENPDWEGNYKARYWEKEWQDIIYGNDDSYLGKILDAGFDGVYLDIIDAFEYFEEE